MAPLIMAQLRQLEDNFTSWHHPRHRRQHHGTARQLLLYLPRDRRLHHLQSLHEDITVLPALRRSAFERQIQPLQKTPGQTALPAFHQIVYANFRRNQDHSLNVRHASVLVFNASVSTKEQA